MGVRGGWCTHGFGEGVRFTSVLEAGLLAAFPNEERGFGFAVWSGSELGVVALAAGLNR